MAEHGSSRIGGVALAASSTIPIQLTHLEDGPVAYFEWTFSFGLIAAGTGNAFAVSILTGPNFGPVGGDDADILTTALFNLMTMYDSGDSIRFQMAPAYLRRFLATLNKGDWSGSFMQSPVNVPAYNAANPQTYKLAVKIPISLEHLFPDGEIFSSGSDRFRTGKFEWAMGSTLTPTVVLTHGSAVVSGLSVDTRMFFGSGEVGDVGPAWTAKLQTVSSNIWTLDGGNPRIWLADQLPVASNPGVAITFEDQTDMSVQDFANLYYNDIVSGQYVCDLSLSSTPYLTYRPKMSFQEMLARTLKKPRIEISQGVTSIAMYDCYIRQPTPSEVTAVANTRGKGGQVNTGVVLPKSIPPSQPIEASMAAYLPVRIRPGKAVPGTGYVDHEGPTQVAAAHAAHVASRHLVKASHNAAKGR